jgi:hypothetical protein
MTPLDVTTRRPFNAEYPDALGKSRPQHHFVQEGEGTTPNVTCGTLKHVISSLHEITDKSTPPKQTPAVQKTAQPSYFVTKYDGWMYEGFIPRQIFDKVHKVQVRLHGNQGMERNAVQQTGHRNLAYKI